MQVVFGLFARLSMFKKSIGLGTRPIRTIEDRPRVLVCFLFFVVGDDGKERNLFFFLRHMPQNPSLIG